MTPTTPITSSGGISAKSHDSGERLAYVALALIPGLGARRLASLLSMFGAASAVLQAPRRQLGSTRGLPQDVTTAVSAIRLDDVSRLVERQRDRGIEHLVPSDPGFPASLRSIPDPPVLLWSRGDRSLLEHPAVAIVGSRNHTTYGARVAERFAGAAAEAGIVVVSGMARGLDAVAHTAALDAGRGTIGVLGHGVDVVYPAANRPLYDRVYAGGLLLSEHQPTERAHAAAFPRRNRLISGLAKVVIVVEAADGSGTMLTVTSALAQGREVLAVPGPIDSDTSRGTNRLIRDGATPLLDVDQLLTLYGAERRPIERRATPPCDLSPVEASVFDALSEGARHIDDLTLRVGLPVGTVLGALLGLELGGLAEQLPGNCYRRKTG